MKYISFLVFTFLISCTQAEQKNNKEPAQNQEPAQSQMEKGNRQNPAGTASLDGCYRRVIKRDTAELKINQSGNRVKGTMLFDNFQIDGSRGMVDGRIEDDRILLWYDFNSEGEHSVMEQVFLRTPEGLIRATGPMINKGDTMLFTDYSQLNFDRDNLFKPVADCDH